MRLDFTLEMPPGRIAASTSSLGASRTASHESKRSRRRRNATSRLRSLVDCDSTVSTSSASGSPCGAITGMPYIARSRARIARTRRAGGRLHGSTGRVSATAAHRIFPAMAPVTEHTETLGEQPAFWRSAPGGDPPVLYLHGVPNTGGLWTPLLARTGGIAPDLPGFGRSGKRGDGDFAMTGYARWLEAFLARAGVDRVRLVVHDWGAVGLLWAMRHPERVERLVLVDAVPFLPGYRWHAVARAWRTPAVGEVAIGLNTRGLWRRLMPRAVADDGWPHFDQGTQRAILRLYRSAPEDALARAGLDLDGSAVRPSWCGAIATATSPRASPTPTPTPWAGGRGAAPPRRRPLAVARAARCDRRDRRLPGSLAAPPPPWRRCTSSSLRRRPTTPRPSTARGWGGAIWDDGWYAGHHVPGYSVLLPLLGAPLGARLTGALAAVAAAWAFARLVDGLPGARPGALWFAAGTATLLITGRTAFLLGAALAVGAALALAAGASRSPRCSPPWRGSAAPSPGPFSRWPPRRPGWTARAAAPRSSRRPPSSRPGSSPSPSPRAGRSRSRRRASGPRWGPPRSSPRCCARPPPARC